jgi:hypothetical protein
MPCISVGIADNVNSTATGAYYDTRMFASNGYIRRHQAGFDRAVQVLPPIILQLNENQGVQVRGRFISGYGLAGTVTTSTDDSVGYLYIKRIA